jgi:hypothetical protein
MMAASVAVFGMAAFFVVFGLLRLGEGHGGCGSAHCDSCSHDCEFEAEGRLP